jgi:hypothetical protein
MLIVKRTLSLLWRRIYPQRRTRRAWLRGEGSVPELKKALAKTKHTRYEIGFRWQQTIVSVLPMNEKVQDHNKDGRSDTTEYQKDEEKLIKISRSVISTSGITLTTYCYVRSALQAYMPATPNEK